jgi:hypothetical protein
MKCKVTLYDAGTVFEEIVIASDYQQAQQKAMARNPGLIVGVLLVEVLLSVLILVKDLVYLQVLQS